MRLSLRLTGFLIVVKKILQHRRIAAIDAQGFVPAISDDNQAAI